jgi:hypothetical protein
VTERERVSATCSIPANAAQIFSTVSSPRGHVQIDGSGMLTSSENEHSLTKVGDAFEIEMDREPLGDVPLGRYTVVNTVTQLIPSELIEWNVTFKGVEPIGHVYGFILAPLKDSVTEVTNYCDWSNITEAWRGHLQFPIVPVTMLEATLANLRRLFA